MTAPLIVLLVMAGGGADPTTSSITGAARQALGPSSVLLVDERTPLPSSDAVLTLADRARADAVVQIEWADTAHSGAILHVHLAGQPGWAVRVIDLPPKEPPDEDGRTLGFALASMVTELGAPAPLAPSTPPLSASSTTASPPAPPPAASQRPATGSDRSAPQQPPIVGVAGATTAPHIAVQATALASLGDGSSPSLGGALSVRVRVLPSFMGQLRGGVRVGDLAEAQASVVSVALGGGVVWAALPASPSRPFEVAFSGDIGAADVLVSLSGQSRSRWLPEAGLALEAAWFIVSRSVALVVAPGIEAGFGTTAVAIGDHTVATIPPFRLIGAFGIRGQL